MLLMAETTTNLMLRCPSSGLSCLEKYDLECFFCVGSGETKRGPIVLGVYRYFVLKHSGQPDTQ